MRRLILAAARGAKPLQLRRVLSRRRALRAQSLRRETRFSPWWRRAYGVGSQSGGLTLPRLGGVWRVQAKVARSAAET
jgi:hypothetical protein